MKILISVSGTGPSSIEQLGMLSKGDHKLNPSEASLFAGLFTAAAIAKGEFLFKDGKLKVLIGNRVGEFDLRNGTKAIGRYVIYLMHGKKPGTSDLIPADTVAVYKNNLQALPKETLSSIAKRSSHFLSLCAWLAVHEKGIRS